MSKQWQIRRGTTVENNEFTGAQGELTMDTDKNQIRLHDGVTQGGIPFGDTVVEWQLPTAQNNYTWYRKYNSGWVEQGGVTPTAIDGIGARQTVTMPVEMSDANYTVYVTITRPNDPDFRDQFLVAGSRTETNFVIYSNWAGSGDGTKSNRGTWLVMGIAA